MTTCPGADTNKYILILSVAFQMRIPAKDKSYVHS